MSDGCQKRSYDFCLFLGRTQCFHAKEEVSNETSQEDANAGEQTTQPLFLHSFFPRL